VRTLPAVSDAPAPGPSPDESDDAAEPVAPEDRVPDEPTGEPGEAAHDESGPTDDVAEEPAPAPATDLAGEMAEVRRELAGMRGDLADARAGIEAFLPDLAASAREETLSHGLADLAREETVASGNARLQKGMDEMVRLTRRADEHVAELHAENQRLRAGELASATLPMIRDLVRLHDEVAQLASASHPEAQADLQLVGSRLLDTLARWGLAPFSPATGDPLDARHHQGVGRVASTDGDPGTIAAVRRPGFAHDDGRTFRPAEVAVFVAPDPAETTVVVDPPAPPPEPDPPSEE
jgi:molecular chaperone GrpE (heat shock protein)